MVRSKPRIWIMKHGLLQLSPKNDHAKLPTQDMNGIEAGGWVRLRKRTVDVWVSHGEPISEELRQRIRLAFAITYPSRHLEVKG